MNLMLLYQVHVLHRSVYKQVHVWGTEQWVVVPVERSKEQLHQSTTLHANACIRSSHRHGRIRLWARLANGVAPRLDPGTGCSRTLALSRRASKTTLRSPPLCMRARIVQYGWDSTSYSAVCARVRVGACTAQGSRWVVGFVCMLQVESRPSGPPYLTGCRSRNKSNTRPIHRFTLAGCPRPVTMLQLMAIQTHMCRITHRQMA